MPDIYPPVPELGWLDELIDELTYIKRWAKDATRLGYAYKYLLWNRRMVLVEAQTDKFLIAFGFVLKYQRLLYGIKLNTRDQKTVEIAEEQYRKLRRGEKL